MNNYLFWMVWCRTFEGDERWHMIRTSDSWNEEMVMDKASSYCKGGVGGDPAEILRVEVGWNNDIYDVYEDE